jgi:hypothetical protein
MRTSVSQTVPEVCGTDLSTMCRLNYPPPGFAPWIALFFFIFPVATFDVRHKASQYNRFQCRWTALEEPMDAGKAFHWMPVRRT